MVTILSLGGSIISPPQGIDSGFIKKFRILLQKHIEKGMRFVIITGGGAPARAYQNAYTQVQAENQKTKNLHDASLDVIGIAATHLNACFMREVFSDYAEEDIVDNPESKHINFTKPVLIAGGWKPGFSTDLDAVILAIRFEAKMVINLSNISRICSMDPNYDSNAVPLNYILWDDLIAMIGTQWIPGMNVPFDPIACKKARDASLTVITTSGSDIKNLDNILVGREYIGTVIANDI